MGQSRKRTGRDGKPRYTAYYEDVAGRRRSAGSFSSKREADRAWHTAEAKVREGRMGDLSRGRQLMRRYVLTEWLPNHEMEARTRETYTYYIHRYVLPTFGEMKMVEILPIDVRRWVVDLKANGVSPANLRQCHTILSAIFTTALNDQLIQLHPCHGVKTPPVARKLRTIITPEQFDAIHAALPNDTARLLVELDVETGLRWGELTELRVRDFDAPTRTITVSRVAIELVPRLNPTGERWVVKAYPKDREHRRLRLGPEIATLLEKHVLDAGLTEDDLLFTTAAVKGNAEVPTPDIGTPTGLTEPNAAGRRYAHGSLSGYSAGGCRCDHCRAAYSQYRARRRAAGLERSERRPRQFDTDDHISRTWFRSKIWTSAVAVAGIRIKVRTHDLRHAHASWLLAGGADLQYVKERMGHSSIITTEKYLHTLDGKDDTALDAFAAVRHRQRGA